MLAAHGAGRAPLRQSNSQQTQPIHFGAAKDFPNFVYPSKRFRDCQCGRPFGSMRESLSEGKVRAEVVDAAESLFARRNCRGRYARGGGAVPARWRCRSFGHSPRCFHAVESSEVRGRTVTLKMSASIRIAERPGLHWAGRCRVSECRRANQTGNQDAQLNSCSAPPALDWVRTAASAQTEFAATWWTRP